MSWIEAEMGKSKDLRDFSKGQGVDLVKASLKGQGLWDPPGQHW